MLLPFKPRSRSRIRAAAGTVLLLLVLVVVCSVPVSGEPKEYVVAVSPDVAVSNLSMDELRHIFLFKKRYWKTAQPIRFILSDGDLKPDSFVLEKIYRMDYPAWRRLVLEKLYQEEIDSAPKVVASEELALRFVASGRGLLTLVSSDQLDDASVKSLTIDGEKPGSTEYPLRR
jgi:hypothetical protein